MISVAFESENSKTLDSINQWTTGNMLKITGVSLNDHFSVDFTHSAISCESLAVQRLGKSYNNVVVIPVPNYLFTVAGTITVVFSDKTIIIPVKTAAKPLDYDNNCKCDVDVDRVMICELLSSGGSSGSGISLDNVYPVGAIYISTVATNPGTLFGFGTWEQIKDTFLLAAGESYEAGATGGEATHTLTVEEMPKHSHSIFFPNAGGSVGAAIGYPTTGSKNTWYAEASKVSDTGSSQPHNNMPPYLTVYMWKRTS